jgi:APA family basic amino acid/polyamine antiporter
LEAQLKRSLTLPLLTLYGLGTILGAGVYVLIGKVAGIAGIYAPVSFLVSAVIAAFTGFSYAQLSSRYPHSAGEALYVSKAFSLPALSTCIGWFVITTGVVSAATLVNGFVGYLAVFISMPEIVAITLVIMLITAIACWGITESVTIAAIVTTIELCGLVIVIGALRSELATLPEHWPDLIPSTDKGVWLGIILGAHLAFYAFIGFEDMVNVIEEVVEPQRSMPMAIILALGVASILYILIALAAVLSLPISELSNSSSPMVTLLEAKSESLATTIGIISLIAILNGALVQIIMGARLLYGMSTQRLAPNWFGKISNKTQTPIRATLLIGAIIWLLAAALPLVTLAKITSSIILAVFAVVNLSLVVVQFREATNFHSLSWRFCLPIIGCLLCLGLLGLQSIPLL